jgi:hypothetical protein
MIVLAGGSACMSAVIDSPIATVFGTVRTAPVPSQSPAIAGIESVSNAAAGARNERIATSSSVKNVERRVAAVNLGAPLFPEGGRELPGRGD